MMDGWLYGICLLTEGLMFFFFVQLSPAAQQMQPTQTLQSGPPSGGRRRRVVDEDPDERRRKFLERNRAAATRCRQKRKVWVMSLEKKAEELTQTNMQLQVWVVSQFFHMQPSLIETISKLILLYVFHQVLIFHSILRWLKWPINVVGMTADATVAREQMDLK